MCGRAYSLGADLVSLSAVVDGAFVVLALALAAHAEHAGDEAGEDHDGDHAAEDGEHQNARVAVVGESEFGHGGVDSCLEVLSGFSGGHFNYFF